MAIEANPTREVTLYSGDGKLEVKTLSERDAEAYAAAIAANINDAGMNEFLPGWADDLSDPDDVNTQLDAVSRAGGVIFGLWAQSEDRRELVGAMQYIPVWIDGRHSNTYRVTAWITRHERGQRVGQRAGALLTQHMFENGGAQVLESEIHKDNFRSQRLAERLLRERRETVTRSFPFLTYVISRERYLRSRDHFIALAQ